jgi:hypothetical protein
MREASMKSRATHLLLFCGLLLTTCVSGCKRSEESMDDRTLEKRSHVETVKPVDRKDPFRP